MLSRSRLLARTASQSILSALIIADANDLIDVRKKNLPVTDLAGASGCRNSLHDFLNHRIGDDQLEFDLRNKIDSIFPAAVKLGVSLLSSMAASLEYGHAFDANLVQRSAYLRAFQLRDLDDGFGTLVIVIPIQSLRPKSPGNWNQVVISFSFCCGMRRLRISSHSSTG